MCALPKKEMIPEAGEACPVTEDLYTAHIAVQFHSEAGHDCMSFSVVFVLDLVKDYGMR